MPRPKKTETKTTKPTSNYLDKIESEVQSTGSRLSLILGALIVIVIGILIYNYFHKPAPEVGPSQQTSQNQQEDVKPENLPGKYTVKDGDTLFIIAEKYYQDGHKYTEIVKANKLTNENAIQPGQVLEIPKLSEASSPTPTETPTTPTMSETPTATMSSTPTPEINNPVPPTEKGGNPAINNNFGPTISGNTYTVQEGDWLSKIAARAYNGDILAYQRLAEANHISNPDLIVPGQVITIPR